MQPYLVTEANNLNLSAIMPKSHVSYRDKSMFDKSI